MELLPLIPEFGKLEIEDVFEFYDFPRLFTAKNLLGQTLVCLSVADGLESFSWLFVPISLERKKSALAGKIDLQTLFKNPEGGIWEVQTYRSRPPIAMAKSASQIPAEWLPEADQFLETDGPQFALTIRELPPQQTLEIANRERRDIGNFLLKKTGVLVEAPARVVGNFLRCTQDLLDALGQVVNGSISLRGAIPAALLDQTQINAAALFSGSFGLQLKAEKNLDLLDTSISSSTFELLFGLMSARADEDLLSNLLHAYKGRVAGRFRAFLEALDDTGVDIGFEWASPRMGRVTEVLLTNSEILKTISIVTRLNEEMAEELSLKANLIGVNLRTKSFEISHATTQERFTGKIAPDAMSKISGAEVGASYKVVLRKYIDVLATTGEERIRWVLVDLTANR